MGLYASSGSNGRQRQIRMIDNLSVKPGSKKNKLLLSLSQTRQIREVLLNENQKTVKEYFEFTPRNLIDMDDLLNTQTY